MLSRALTAAVDLLLDLPRVDSLIFAINNTKNEDQKLKKRAPQARASLRSAEGLCDSLTCCILRPAL